MAPDRSALRRALAACIAALGLACGACTQSHPGSVQVPPTSTTSSAARPATSTTVPPTTQALAHSTVMVQIYSSAVVLTLGTHQGNLASAVQKAGFVSPNEFDFTVSGIALSEAGGGRTTSASGAVSEVDLVTTSIGTDVRVLFRTAESHDQVAVGAGTTIQVNFS